MEFVSYSSPCCSLDLPLVPGADPDCWYCEGTGTDPERWQDSTSVACGVCEPTRFKRDIEPAHLDPDGDGWLDGCLVIPARYAGGVLDPSAVTSITIHRGVSGGDIAKYFASMRDGRKVSAHHDVRRDGEIRQMVPYSRVAWHSGKRNKSAIGVEHQGPIDGDWPSAQIEATLRLVESYQALCVNLVSLEAHSVVYPKTRRDPGPLFPWQRFESTGLTLLH